MEIPLSCNQAEFVRIAKGKGISIQSRYPGVYLKKTGKYYYWIVRYMGKEKHKYIGSFPLNEKAEKRAGEAYQDYLIENNITPRYKVKRHYKKLTICK